MDDDGGLGIRNWGYYEQPTRNNLGLQLMPSVAMERDTKNLLSNGAFLQRNCGIVDTTVPMDYVRGEWAPHQRDKMLQAFAFNHPNYAAIPDTRTIPMPLAPDPSKDDRPLQIDEPTDGNVTSLKKRSQGRTCKAPKPKKSNKNPTPRAPRGTSGRKNTELVINGIDLDISGIPTPVCTCTGAPQPCYRWGMGGWQSACCTNSLSTYPLPMSTKRRGARIAGRKMSQGAFKKVLEKLAGEGYNLSNPIDLRSYWAKHGTNKFVIIR